MKRLEQFEIFRFLGAVVVLLFHTARETSFFHKLPVILQNGPAWVHFYFLLSGFVLTYGFYNYEKIDLKKFYTSRFIKLYPLYFISLLMICFFTGFKGKEKMIGHLFLLQDWIFPKALDYNAAAWYLSALAFLYLLFPNILELFKKYEKTMITVSIVILLYTCYIHTIFLPVADNVIMHQLFNYFPVIHLGSFMAGMSLCRICSKFKNRKIYSFLSVIYIVLLAYFMNNVPSGIPYFGSYVTISFIPLIFFLSKDSGLLSRILSNKIFILLGSFSYAVYIFHLPVKEGFSKFVPVLNNKYFIIYFFTVVLFSVLLTFINKKVLILLKK